MSDDDNLPDLRGPLPLDLSKVEVTPAHIIPTTEFIRPCAHIEPETKEFVGFPTRRGMKSCLKFVGWIICMKYRASPGRTAGLMTYDAKRSIGRRRSVAVFLGARS